MITGAHSVIYSKNPEADRAFLRDVLQLTNVDVGHGWLIFGLPPAEVAVHPSSKNDLHEFYLMCDDVEAFIAQMKKSASPAGRCGIQAGGCSRSSHSRAAGSSASISHATRGRRR